MSPSAPRPVAFMVMPFRRKPVPNPPPGAPAEVDFDSLWDLAYAPALSQLGYLPVRADSEAGSVIIKDMLERLAFADLVLADMTIPNGNVYYEVGIRHVAQQTDCVLISADWSRQLFDVDQMRSLRYPLQETSVTEASAPAIQQVLIDSLETMKAAKTPFHALVTTQADSAVFRQQLQELSDFQARLRADHSQPRAAAAEGARADRLAAGQPGHPGDCLRAAHPGARQPRLAGRSHLHRPPAAHPQRRPLHPRAGPAGPVQAG